MSEHITGWEQMARRDFERARAAFEARADFTALVDEAARRGFRRITLAEQLDPGSVDAFTWRGGVWVKAGPAA